MPSLSVTKTYLTGNVLTETDLDNIRTSIETFFNSTKIDGSNVQTGWITTAYLAAAAGILGTQIADRTIANTNIANAAITGQEIVSGVTLAGNCTVSGTLTVNNTVIANTTLRVGGASGTQMSRATTSPSITRLILGESLQFGSSSGPIFNVQGSGGRTMGLADGTSGFSYPLLVSAMPATHGMVVLRGTVIGGASSFTAGGEGMSVAHGNTGVYTVTFTNSFATTPTVIVGSAESTANRTANAAYSNVNTSVCTIRTFGGASASDDSFSILVIGERGV